MRHREVKRLRLKRGDLVSRMFGWRESFNSPSANLQKLDTSPILMASIRTVAPRHWGDVIPIRKTARPNIRERDNVLALFEKLKQAVWWQATNPLLHVKNRLTA
jgi:hypothetical protein